jgi:hypothetical protein
VSDLDILFWLVTAPYFVIAALYLIAWHEAIRGREELRGAA